MDFSIELLNKGWYTIKNNQPTKQPTNQPANQPNKQLKWVLVKKQPKLKDKRKYMSKSIIIIRIEVSSKKSYTWNMLLILLVHENNNKHGANKWRDEVPIYLTPPLR